MKSIAFLSILAVGSALAGEKSPIYDKSPIMPPAPSLYQWFAGGTVGYLFENDTEMYTLHVGADLPNQAGAWDQAIYLEVGYFDVDDCIQRSGTAAEAAAAGESSQYADWEQAYNQGAKVCLDLEVIPVTLNYKLERQVSQSLNAYLGAGVGAAFIDAEISVGSMKASDDDTVFYGQVFAGLLYNVNPSFEIYGGARVIYFDEPSFSVGGSSFDFGDLQNAGFDVENTDYSLELGARVNF